MACAPLLQAAIIAVGWGVVYYLQSRQSRRRTLREQVEVTRSAAKQLRRAALQFHTAMEFDAGRRDELLEMIDDIDSNCDLFPKIVRAQRPDCLDLIPKIVRVQCQRACALLPETVRTRLRFLINAVDPSKCEISIDRRVSMRQAITLKHMGDGDWHALPHDALQIQQIKNTIADVLAALEDTLLIALD